MDPDVALDELLRLVKHVERCTEEDRPDRIDSGDILGARELVAALDSWLRIGGFPPVVGAIMAQTSDR